MSPREAHQDARDLDDDLEDMDYVCELSFPLHRLWVRLRGWLRHG